jgi:predicted nuclease of predicted toxin-antitoxin system
VKLLLDQNLSRRLPPILAKAFPGVTHVGRVGLLGAHDERIWRYARDHGYSIVSKDSDFMHRSLVRGQPPKVIHLQIGNLSTRAIGSMILRRKAAIRRFLKNRVESLLVLH